MKTGEWESGKRMRAEEGGRMDTGMTVRICYELHMKSIFGGTEGEDEESEECVGGRGEGREVMREKKRKRMFGLSLFPTMLMGC